MTSRRFAIIMLLAIATIFILFLFQGCTPAQRLKHIIARHPELLATTHDTIYHKDIFTTKEVHKDTVFSMKENEHDTVIVHKGNLTVEYYHIHDSIVLYGRCDTIRIIERIPIAVDNNAKITVAGKTFWESLKDDIMFILLGMLILVIIYIILKLLKKV